MSLTIRPMRGADVPAASKLVTDCYRFLAERQGFSAAQLKGLLDQRCSAAYVGKCLREFEHHVAEVDGEMVGLVGIEGHELAELWVSPKRHRQGIGAALFRKAEDVISAAGHPVLTVHTTGYGTPFYRAMGCRIVGQKPCDRGPLKGWPHTNMEKRR